MRQLHLIVGALAAVVFLLSGQFVHRRTPPMPALDAPASLFRPRHIYILGSGLVNLMLGLYLNTGSALLVLAHVPLILAFAAEPSAGFQPEMLWNSAGLYALFPACMLRLAAYRGNPPATERV